ncbi:hypothetical protein ACMFMG_012034 [Clarireedia jacksonii]
MPSFKHRTLSPIYDYQKRRRAFGNRLHTVMKKSDELAVKCDSARIWVLAQHQGEMYLYASDDSIPPPVSIHDPMEKKGPGDFRTHNEAKATGFAAYTPAITTSPSTTRSTPTLDPEILDSQVLDPRAFTLAQNEEG